MSRRHWRIVVLGLLMMVADGLDSTIAAFVYPRLEDDWGTDVRTVTVIVTLSVLAMTIGGATAGPLADRYGRKGVIVTGIAVFGLGTACMGITQNVGAFAATRIVSCLGLGAILPTVMALVADWTPAKRRVQMVALAFAGVTAGITVGGVLASTLIPVFGWPTLLVVTGLAPLLLIPAVVRYVPESVGVLITRGRPAAEIHKALSVIAPDQDLSHVVWDETTVQRRPQRPARVVMSREFKRITFLLWMSFFLAQGMTALIITYMPLLVEQTGSLTSSQAAVAVAVFGWGGLTGQLSVSFALKRFDRFQVLSALWALSIIGFVAAALWAAQFAALLAVAFLLGLCLPAANSALQAITAVAYPPAARATGVSWANTAGKLGPIASGLTGGLMVDAGWTLGTVLLILVVPVGICIVATLALRARSRGPQAEPPHPEPQPLATPASEHV
ncbi:MFS transporter [Streptomyces sp. MZ04]|nr:MFS transporter [Streptomyces sp. MZ04]